MKTKRGLLLFMIPFMASVPTAYAKDGDTGGRGGGHYVQDCDGVWMTLDEYRLLNSAKSFEVLTDPDTQAAASIVQRAIQNLSVAYPRFGEKVRASFQRMRWLKSCQPLKVVEDHELSTVERLNLVQGAIQDVKQDTVVWGTIENQGKPDLVKARLIAHEVLLNTFGNQVRRDYLARASMRLLQFSDRAPLSGAAGSKMVIRTQAVSDGQLWISVDGRARGRAKCQKNTMCELVVDLGDEDIGLELTVSFAGAFEDFEVSVNGRVAASEVGTNGRWDAGRFGVQPVLF